MLTIRTDKEIDEMMAYLRNHKVKFSIVLRDAIRNELRKLCKDFEMEDKRVKNAPNWLYDD